MNRLFAGVLFAAISSQAMAAQVTIDFESDAIGSIANGSSSVDAPDVTFTDTSGSDLFIDDYGVQSDGQALLVDDDDPSALQIDFASPTDFLSIDFGNDDACCSDAGDVALLTLTLGGSPVDQVSVVLNRDDLMNQTISYSGELFDRAVFVYADPGFNPIDLIEIVDNIIYEDAPAAAAGPAEPVPALPLWGLAALASLIGWAGSRKLRS
ncbi:hypothetical protein E4634_05945 [Mangrovimicrobium sediminis]|uniref:PEP-CTERM sorting domain-containing protein n=1 Tax=Mangrovimicrobium sediminis TaxID=2562682 RepID=A0A4Z0M5G9_9GAMM|nr:hypothetical protein [Haliea sp. SAOS-164]TGD74739.1 hypothetical protein E4634_05945 [Haliea sp. SAOS-164]